MRKLKPAIPLAGALMLGFMAIVPLRTAAQEAWSLQRCLDHAFEHNIQIQLVNSGDQRSHWHADRYRCLSAEPQWKPLPRVQPVEPLTLSPTNSWSHPPFGPMFGLSTGMVLFNGQNHLNLRRAKLAQASAAAQREIAENNVVLTIAGAFLNVLFQEEFVRVAEYNRQATARQVNRMRSMVAAGAAAEFDLYDVEAQLAADEANIVSTNNALGLAKLNLVQLLHARIRGRWLRIGSTFR